MQNSKIEWTNHTANLWHGCSKVHAGCDNCYAETLSRRWGNDIWGNDKPRKMIKSVWRDLVKIQETAFAKSEIHRVFIGSMMDIFEKPMPLIDSKGLAIIPQTIAVNGDDSRVMKNWIGTDFLRHHLFTEIDSNFYPNILFLFLTKRPSNINKYIPEHWRTNPPKNVMFGTSVSDQKTFDTLVPQLLEVNGRHFLSVEPQLGPLSISGQHKGIDWVIQGGESGHKKRHFDLDWARSLRNECQLHGIPYFFKQIDGKQEIPDDLQIRQFPETI